MLAAPSEVLAPGVQGAARSSTPAVATFYAGIGGNDLYWRCEAPARVLGAREEIIPEKQLNDVVMFPHDEPPFRWWLEYERVNGDRDVMRSRDEYDAASADWKQSVVQASTVFPDHEGTAVWIRPCLPRAALAESMRYQHGIRTLAELDDNYLAPSRQSLYFRATGWGEKDAEQHIQAVCSMNGIIFSTDLLRDMYWKRIKARYKKAAKLLELHVCRNHVAASDWPEPLERGDSDPIRVGWMGSPSHLWDVDLAWPALMHARNLGAQTWMIGLNPVTDAEDALMEGRGSQTTRSQAKIDAWKKVDFLHVPWRQPDKYERLALPVDIGLCPLLTNQMTLGKSDVKAIEYGISGAACIAWNNPVYNRTLIHGETALLVGSAQEMLEAVELLMKDEPLRLRLIANLQQYIREERGEKQMREEWLSAING